MGWSLVRSPEYGGPCPEPCDHHDCRWDRQAVESVCVACGKLIGLETPYHLAHGHYLFSHLAKWPYYIHVACTEGDEPRPIRYGRGSKRRRYPEVSA